MNTQVVGVSIDSQFSHKGWLATGAITPDKTLRHPLVADLSKNISRDYGVLNDAGFALRGTFVIDPKGKIRAYSCVDAPVGRNVDDTLRLVQALQYVEKAGGKEVCPVNWKPGAAAIKVG